MSMSNTSSLDTIRLPSATDLASDNNVELDTDRSDNQVSARTRASIGSLTTKERSESLAASEESNRWENAGLVSLFLGAACFIVGLILTTYALPLIISASVLFLISAALLAKAHYVDKANDPAFTSKDLHNGYMQGGTKFQLSMNQIARDAQSGIAVLDTLCDGGSVAELRTQIHEQPKHEMDGQRLEHYQLVRPRRFIHLEVSGRDQSVLLAVHEAVLLQGVCERRNIAPDMRLNQEIDEIKKSRYSEIIFESSENSDTETQLIDRSELNFSSPTASEKSDITSFTSPQLNARPFSPSNLRTLHKFAPTQLPFSPRESDEFESGDSTKNSYDSEQSVGSLILDHDDLTDLRLDFMSGNHLQNVCAQIRECTFDVVVDADSFSGTSVGELRTQLDDYIDRSSGSTGFGQKYAKFDRLLNGPAFENDDEDPRPLMKTVLKVFALQKLCGEKGLGLDRQKLSDARLLEEYQAIQSSGFEELIMLGPSQNETDKSRDFAPMRSESETWD
ncbi:YrhK family protein [Thalassoglobus sp. JC818]|uniref:YrhK family protein n=1 Tax=Thalassoglobus sp. JC818 TaxID=3232136 RepID=UPI003458721D